MHQLIAGRIEHAWYCSYNLNRILDYYYYLNLYGVSIFGNKDISGELCSINFVKETSKKNWLGNWIKSNDEKIDQEVDYYLKKFKDSKKKNQPYFFKTEETIYDKFDYYLKFKTNYWEILKRQYGQNFLKEYFKREGLKIYKVNFTKEYACNCMDFKLKGLKLGSKDARVRDYDCLVNFLGNGNKRNELNIFAVLDLAHEFRMLCIVGSPSNFTNETGYIINNIEGSGRYNPAYVGYGRIPFNLEPEMSFWSEYNYTNSLFFYGEDEEEYNKFKEYRYFYRNKKNWGQIMWYF